MDQLKILGVALGLACLAGVNLYLTVFVTGLAIQQHWIVLSTDYASLAVLGNPLVIWISGALYFLEFVADKIPWVDSAWDTVHTVIRPIGGALLAIRVLGQTSPAFDVAVGLVAGSASLITHAAKASTRLVANTSPEPFSNIGLSLFEDAAVVAGLALIHFNPVLALGVFVLLLAIILYLAPKIFRALRVKLWLIGKKLNRPAESEQTRALTATLPGRYAAAFARENSLDETLAWAAPCICKRMRGVAANSFGLLLATNEEAGQLLFIPRRGWRRIAQRLDLSGATVSREARFLSENLVIDGASRAIFLFERGRDAEVRAIVEFLTARKVAPIASAAEASPLA